MFLSRLLSGVHARSRRSERRDSSPVSRVRAYHPCLEELEKRELLDGNLIVNGDFEQGNTGFMTGYTYSPGNSGSAAATTIELTDTNTDGGHAFALDDISLTASPSATINDFPTPTPGSNPDSITGGPDGNVWFTENLGNKIGQVTPGGSISEF